MFVNNFMRSEEAFLTPFMAMVLPVILLVGALILESGNFYVRHEQLRGIAKQSANSGLIAFSQILENQAVINKNNLCAVEIPPEICNSQNMFDFLSETDVQNQILTLENQNTVVQNAQSFAQHYDPLLKILNANVMVQFPFDYSGENKVKIKVSIREHPEKFFSHIWSNEDEIIVEAVSFLSFS